MKWSNLFFHKISNNYKIMLCCLIGLSDPTHSIRDWSLPGLTHVRVGFTWVYPCIFKRLFILIISGAYLGINII